MSDAKSTLCKENVKRVASLKFVLPALTNFLAFNPTEEEDFFLQAEKRELVFVGFHFT